MSQPTAIEWTDFTWNPTRGCSRISEGCRNCYAEKIAARFSQGGMSPASAFYGFAILTKGGPRWTGRVELLEHNLLDPLRKRSWRGKRVFVNSMSDLFHEALPDEAIDKVFAVMALCPDITFQVLTKRAARMRDYFRDLPYRTEQIGIDAERISGLARYLDDGSARWPLPIPHVHLGISAENQPTLDDRATHLLRTPAAVRFISAEPLLGPISIARYVRRRCVNCDAVVGPEPNMAVGVGADLPCGCVYCWHCADNRGRHEDHVVDDTCGALAIDWVITGGESGPNARLSHTDWFRRLRDQCAAAGVPFFFKQWGEFLPDNQNPEMTPEGRAIAGASQGIRVGKKAAGNLLDGVQHLAFPTANPQPSTVNGPRP